MFEAYGTVCERVGVRLASESDPEKMLRPSMHATVLGVSFETDTWHWYIREDKMARIIHLLKDGRPPALPTAAYVAHVTAGGEHPLGMVEPQRCPRPPM